MSACVPSERSPNHNLTSEWFLANMYFLNIHISKDTLVHSRPDIQMVSLQYVLLNIQPA